MPAGVYKGAKIAFVTDPEIKEKLKTMADEENRTLSKMVETLIYEALSARESQQPKGAA